MVEQRFKNSKWIWNRKEYGEDEYAEFKFDFSGDPACRIKVFIASDSNYNLYINGKIAAFGQYADYPFYKVYDELDVTKYCVNGVNEARIIVWYYGKDTQTYIKDAAGVIFEVVCGDKTVAYSSEETLSRVCTLYENGYKKLLTSQLGFSFKYYGNAHNSESFTKSVISEKSYNLNPRQNDKIIILERVPITVTKLENSYLIDLHEETTGFLDLDIVSEKEQNVLIAYSQFLEGGRVKRFINSMDFSVEYVVKQGENEYINYFRRLSGRYLEVFAAYPIKINYVGIRPVKYPLEAKKANYKSALHNKIYNVSVRTLSACMHEHYEDTPWREQAMYTMDSRNEMLCTYVAYGDYKFARSSLFLISLGLRKDGLLSICYPAGRDIPIPFFSLAYFIEVYEYVEKSGDKTILTAALPVLKTIIRTFESKIESNALIANFPYPYWNFYEWSAGSDNGDQIARKESDYYPRQYDLILNCAFLYAVGYFKKICAFVGESYDFDEDAMKTAIKNTFYDESKGLFKATTVGKPYYTILGNSLVILCGIAGEEIAEKLLSGKTIVPITLSMNTFLYEALLKINKDKYKSFILNDIDKKYSKMLDAGATTFWETEEGAKSLANTGSLCHGWSAMPIYYYDLLNGEEYFNGTL